MASRRRAGRSAGAESAGAAAETEMETVPEREEEALLPWGWQWAPGFASARHERAFRLQQGEALLRHDRWGSAWTIFLFAGATAR